MTTRRIKDTAGLLPDRVTVELDGHSDDFGAVAAVLTANTPRRRIEALRRHPALSEQADRLATRLDALGGTADHPLLTAIAQAEQAGLYQDAAPLAIRDAGRQRSTKDGGKNSGETRRRNRENRKADILKFRADNHQLNKNECWEKWQAIHPRSKPKRTTFFEYLKDVS